jgi:hypothetical protein
MDMTIRGQGINDYTTICIGSSIEWNIVLCDTPMRIMERDLMSQSSDALALGAFTPILNSYGRPLLKPSLDIVHRISAEDISQSAEHTRAPRASDAEEDFHASRPTCCDTILMFRVHRTATRML